MANPIIKRIIVSLFVGLLTIAIDFFGVHYFSTDLQEIPAYYVAGFIGASLIAFLLYPAYQKWKGFAVLGGLLFAGYKGVVYYLQPYFPNTMLSVAPTVFQIKAFGIGNRFFLFFYWLIMHSLSFILAFTIVYYICEYFWGD